MSKVVEITEDNFEQEVLKQNGPVLIDISTNWCGPCKMLTPIVDELSEEFNGKIKVGKLDADDNPTIAANYNVLSVPTLLFFKDGELIDTKIGLIPKQELQIQLTSML